MPVEYEPISKSDYMAGKYAYTTRDGLDGYMAKIFRHSDGSINERATYSSRYRASQSSGGGKRSKPSKSHSSSACQRMNDYDDVYDDGYDAEYEAAKEEWRFARENPELYAKMKREQKEQEKKEGRRAKKWGFTILGGMVAALMIGLGDEDHDTLIVSLGYILVALIVLVWIFPPLRRLYKWHKRLS